ncbi:MAG: hypothetical protein M3N29_08995 [Chloroflexota bacterium]|nr:hypothetical protein [Chloroflexota bacterium]
MRYPANLTRGGYVEGFVPFDRHLSPETAIDWLPPGIRPAILDQAGKRVGAEVEVDAAGDGLWVAAQLDKASRYREFVEQLVKNGHLSLRSLTMPRLSTKTYGLIEQPLVGWDLVPLREAGISYAVSAVDVARHFEEAGTYLAPSVRTALVAQIINEATRRD